MRTISLISRRGLLTDEILWMKHSRLVPVCLRFYLITRPLSKHLLRAATRTIAHLSPHLINNDRDLRPRLAECSSVRCQIGIRPRRRLRPPSPTISRYFISERIALFDENHTRNVWRRGRRGRIATRPFAGHSRSAAKLRNSFQNGHLGILCTELAYFSACHRRDDEPVKPKASS